MTTNLKSWVIKEFAQLKYPITEEIASYLIEIEEEAILQEYINAMIDISVPSHKKFIAEFIKRKKETETSFGPGFYRKPDLKDDDQARGKCKDKEKSPGVTSLTNSDKKKTKFISIYSEGGQNKEVILLPGRHKCDCQASKHKLINNCLKCGRIVCEQEGSGPCAFCQNLVISKEEKEIISKGTKKSEALHNKLIHSKKIIDTEAEIKKSLEKDTQLQKAIEHKNTLLKYDQMVESRTKVYDDESDYFQSNSKWLNPESREKLQKLEDEIKKKKYDRSNKNVTIDLLGRKLISEEIPVADEHLINEILQSNKSNIYCNESQLLSELHIQNPIYIDTHDKDIITHNKLDNLHSNNLHRLQDKELLEMRDDGMCLSMHQPWASLLVAGIKIHEGRMWYSSHRGRLWIAAATKVPIESEISQIEQMYKVILKADSIKFPKYYPTGCLLGCVDVIDVLPQEEYKNCFPDGESDSPYVFVCENPQEMTIKFPIKGQHKIYKLDPKIHLAAKNALNHV